MPTVDQRKTRGSAVDRDRGVTVGRAGISCFVEKFSDSDMNATSGTFTTSPLFGSLIGAGAGISGERLLAASGGLCRPLRNGLRSNSLCGSLWVLIPYCIHYLDRHGYRARVHSLGADPTLVVSDILTD